MSERCFGTLFFIVVISAVYIGWEVGTWVLTNLQWVS